MITNNDIHNFDTKDVKKGFSSRRSCFVDVLGSVLDFESKLRYYIRLESGKIQIVDAIDILFCTKPFRVSELFHLAENNMLKHGMIFMCGKNRCIYTETGFYPFKNNAVHHQATPPFKLDEAWLLVDYVSIKDIKKRLEDTYKSYLGNSDKEEKLLKEIPNIEIDDIFKGIAT